MPLNIDQQELDKFAALAARWWDPEGDMKALHQVNPLRLEYINSRANLAGKTVLDVGCGGGILAESMAQLGAKVTGIDMHQAIIDAAKLHLLESGSDVEYLRISAEEFAAERPATYDVVTCLEMLEHVPDPASVIAACAKLLKPGGHIFFSTLNRNLKCYLLAIVGAEYILNIIPKNTHDYRKFIRPAELGAWARAVGLAPQDLSGIHYQPFSKVFSLTKDVSVNYLLHAVKS